MKDSTPEVNKVLFSKLGRLLSFLHRSGIALESVVQKAANKHIRTALSGVLLETNQYKREVDAQMQCLRPPGMDFLDATDDPMLPGTVSTTHLIDEVATDDQIMNVCCNEEVNFEKEYRNILNEYFPYNGLRDMLRHQLNGFKCAFMQLKLLRSVM